MTRRRERAPELVDGEPYERLTLGHLEVGDVLHITTGSGEAAWQYDFMVETPGQWPTGLISAVKPDGETVAAVRFSMHGAGNWTTRKQNPVQQQDRGFTSYFDDIYVGGFLVGAFEDYDDRAVFDSPGQEISQITINGSPEEPN